MAKLSRRERELLAVIDCQDEIDLPEACGTLDISQNTFKSRVKEIRRKLAAPPVEFWIEDLPARARAMGENVPVTDCWDELPDDGAIRVDPEQPYAA